MVGGGEVDEGKSIGGETSLGVDREASHKVVSPGTGWLQSITWIVDYHYLHLDILRISNGSSSIEDAGGIH